MFLPAFAFNACLIPLGAIVVPAAYLFHNLVRPALDQMENEKEMKKFKSNSIEFLRTEWYKKLPQIIQWIEDSKSWSNSITSLSIETNYYLREATSLVKKESSNNLISSLSPRTSKNRGEGSYGASAILLKRFVDKTPLFEREKLYFSPLLSQLAALNRMINDSLGT